MPLNLKGRSCLTLEEFSEAEIHHLIDQAIELKRLKAVRVFPRTLENRNLCLIFLKPSTRTRTSFVVAARDEGAHTELLTAEEIRFGVKESIRDIARVLGRMFDGIAFRGFDHQVAVALSRHAGVPVWNGLTDEHHPTQVLADLMTIKEEFGRVTGTRIAYVGDGRNNMVTSLIVAAARTGMDLRIVAPPSLQPAEALVAAAQRTAPHPAARITVTADILAGVRDCMVIYNDVWLSMGEDAKLAERTRALAGYRVSEAMVAATGRADTIYMNCLPSLHDDETSFGRAHPEARDTENSVFEGEYSRVFDQAENRMHTIKALLVSTV